MKRKCLVVGVILLFVMTGIIPGIAQDIKKPFLPTSKGWMKTFGEFGEDWGYSVQQTVDGGYIIAGETHYIGMGGDVWLIKTDGTGNKVWDKIFGGAEDDKAYSVQQTSDNGYIIAGMTFSFGAGWVDAWLIKTDENGVEQWNKTYGGEYIDIAKSVRQTADGGYIITGETWSFGSDTGGVWLIKTDNNGKEIWNKTFGGTGYDYGSCVQQTTDGGYIIAGTTDSFGAGNKDFWLIKTDGNGNKVWDKTYGGKDIDEAYSVQQTTDGGYIIAGYTMSFGTGLGDAWLIKTDGNGNKIWDRTFGRKYGGDFVYSVHQTSDNGYIIAGGTGSFGDVNGDVLLIKTDSQGKSKTTSLDNLWFEWLFERFPHAFPLLRQLME
jgi:hypothetical protein